MPRTSENPVFKARTVLGGETRFAGKLRFKDSLKIDGRFEGSIESSGFLVVESGAEVIADISVGTLVVGGIVQGDVNAGERLELLPGGQVVGNVRCPSLVMADGTGIQGRCEMLNDPAGIDVFSMPPDRLKKSVSRVD